MDGHLKRVGLAHLHKVYRRSERVNKAAILEMIDPRPGGRLLDCRCGDGEFTVQVACRARVAEAYGTECLDECIAEATDRGVIVTKADPNKPLPYRSRFFDIVHASQVSERLSGIDLFLEEIKRVLRPDGYAILSSRVASWHDILSPIPGMTATRLPVSSEAMMGNTFGPLWPGSYPRQGDGPLHICSLQAFPELCRYHGFRVERWTCTGFWPFLPNLARSIGERGAAHNGFWIAKLQPEP